MPKKNFLIVVLFRGSYEIAFKIGYGLGTSGIVWEYWDICFTPRTCEMVSISFVHGYKMGRKPILK